MISGLHPFGGNMIVRGLNDFNLETFHSGEQAAPVSFLNTHEIKFQPDFWVVVASLTAGYVIVYPGKQRNDTMQQFYLRSHTLVLPMGIDALTIHGFAMTGFYSLYAVRGLDGFKIIS